MELLVIIGVIAFLRFIAGRMTPDEASPSAPPLPAPPTGRRVARKRVPKIDSATFEPSIVSQTPPPVQVLPVAVRPILPRVAPRRAIAPAFRGKEALRKAMIVREVLGPPLSLR